VVETVAESIKRFSLIFTQTVKRDGEVLCVMRVKVGSLDAVTLRPKAMGEALLAAFAAERHDEED